MASISLFFGRPEGVTSCQDCEASRVVCTNPLLVPAQRTDALSGEGARTVSEVRRGRWASSKSSLPPASRSSRSTASSSSFRGECVFEVGADLRPAIAAAGGFQDVLRAEVERVRILRRKNQRRHL